MSSDPSVKFIMSRFSKFYRDAPLIMPDRFSRREFGFMFFDLSYVKRHLAFNSRANLKNYLVENVPSHAYYSSAYYQKPNAPTMAEKEWLGADLIFDLDADHVKGASGLAYEEMLGLVKKEVIRLLDEFVLGDFGFNPKDVRIVFSGGRGYHVHVANPGVTRLSSHERREIVDYITGIGLDIDWVFPPTPIEISSYKDRVNYRHRRRMPKVTDEGWLARIRKGVDSLFNRMDELSYSERVAMLMRMCDEGGISTGEKTAAGLIKELFDGKAGQRGIDRMRNEDVFEIFSDDRYLKLFLAIVKNVTALEIAGETDEPVTSDIKRLIRLPGSLHGKTGFEVVLMTRERLESFDPFTDAVARVFEENTVRVNIAKPVSVKLRGEDFSLREGQTDVPEFAAVYLICRRLATVSSH